MSGFPGEKRNNGKLESYCWVLLLLGWEEPLEKEMTIHFNILAWRIPWTEKLGGLQSVHGVTKSRAERLSTHAYPF